MQSSTVVLESQVDWLTASVHSEDKSNRLQALLSAVSLQEKGAGNTTHPWHLLGYVGYRCGRLRVGWRGTATLAQLSGDLAARLFHDVVSLADSVSRVDLAVTVRMPIAHMNIGWTHYDGAEAAYREGKLDALPRLVTDGAGGCTLYVGARSSNVFLRCYDKEAESVSRSDADDVIRYTGCWRYEVEYKGERAAAAARTLEAFGHTAETTSDLVYQEFANHFIVPEFDVSTPRRLIGGFRRRSDNDRRLQWFRKSVAPAVKALLASGRRRDVEDALGLTPLDQPF